MKSVSINTGELRVLAQLLSVPVFRKIVCEEDPNYFEKKVSKYLPYDSYSNNMDAVSYLYKLLQKQYRCEYVYKNSLVNDILNTYRLDETVILNELKLGASKADLVLLNGSIRIYEIKTELDSLCKLSKQLSDYQKFADKIYVVTDKRYVDRLMDEYLNTNIGIIALNEKNNLEIIRESTENHTLFEFDVIFKILRKQEYLDLVFDNFNFVPEVSNTKIFRVCYDLLSNVNISDLQSQVLKKLKERRIIKPEFLKSSNTPIELKHICNSLNFSEYEYQKLYNFLATKSICTNLT